MTPQLITDLDFLPAQIRLLTISTCMCSLKKAHFWQFYVTILSELFLYDLISTLGITRMSLLDNNMYKGLHFRRSTRQHTYFLQNYVQICWPKAVKMIFSSLKRSAENILIISRWFHFSLMMLAPLFRRELCFCSASNKLFSFLHSLKFWGIKLCWANNFLLFAIMIFCRQVDLLQVVHIWHKLRHSFDWTCATLLHVKCTQVVELLLCKFSFKQEQNIYCLTSHE